MLLGKQGGGGERKGDLKSTLVKLFNLNLQKLCNPVGTHNVATQMGGRDDIKTGSNHSGTYNGEYR